MIKLIKKYLKEGRWNRRCRDKTKQGHVYSIITEPIMKACPGHAFKLPDENRYIWLSYTTSQIKHNVVDEVSHRTHNMVNNKLRSYELTKKGTSI